jgi:oligopeptide/dipeptide ABC transporter ATP-binding protein
MLLSVEGLTKRYSTGGVWGQRHTVLAVNGVDLEIDSGETLGLVGESGSGKSTIGRCIARLIEPTEGRITFAGQDFLRLTGPLLRNERRRMGMIFQDPYASLNPRWSVARAIAEPLVNAGMSPASRAERVSTLLEHVGMDPAFARRFPHELSGGQRQRVAVARALATQPQLVICDEAVSSLDVLVQAQILTLLQALQRELQLSYLFISHNLAVVRLLSHRVAVVYQGRVVEQAPSGEFFAQPRHPYTQELLRAIPSLRPVESAAAPKAAPNTATVLGGDARGCPFAPRCPRVEARCRQQAPVLRMVAPDHSVSCHLV